MHPCMYNYHMDSPHGVDLPFLGNLGPGARPGSQAVRAVLRASTKPHHSSFHLIRTRTIFLLLQYHCFARFTSFLSLARLAFLVVQCPTPRPKHQAGPSRGYRVVSRTSPMFSLYIYPIFMHLSTYIFVMLPFGLDRLNYEISVFNVSFPCFRVLYSFISYIYSQIGIL